MKRLVCCILVFICLLSISAYALAEITPFEINEDFYIRNGITFGMSADEIHQIEVENGNVLIEDSSWQFIYSEISAAYATNLAGYPCDILYYFNDEGNLTGFKYVLEKENEFKSIFENLKKKYGKAGSANDRPPFETQTLNISRDMAFLNPKITTYNFWLVQYQDCFVYIEITTLKMDEGTHYRIDYSVFSYEEAAVALGIKEFLDQQAEQSVENDL